MDNESAVYREVWANTHEGIKDVNGVPVHFRTLYDFEELDALTKASAASSQAVTEFTLARWYLAYAIKAVQQDVFEGTPEAKYNEILKWPNIIIRLCIAKYFELVKEEEELVSLLGESGGDQLPMGLDNDSEFTGSSVNQSGLEIGQDSSLNLDALSSSLTS